MFNYLYLDTDKVSENLNALEIGGANAPVITLLKFKLRYIVDPIFENIKEKIPDIYAPKEDDKVYSEAAENLNFISDNTLDAIFV